MRDATQESQQAFLQRWKLLLAAGAAIVVLMLPAASRAAEFKVDDTSDASDWLLNDGKCRTTKDTCSVRAAVEQCEHTRTSESCTILVPRGKYFLFKGPLQVTRALNIIALDGEAFIYGYGAVNPIRAGNARLGVRNASVQNLTW